MVLANAYQEFSGISQRMRTYASDKNSLLKSFFNKSNRHPQLTLHLVHYYSGRDFEGRIHRNTVNGKLDGVSYNGGYLELVEDGVKKIYRFYDTSDRIYGRHEMVIESIDMEGKTIWPPVD